MLWNLFWFAVGLVAGVIHHAYLQPKLAKLWASVKAKAKEYGIGVRRDNG